MGGKSCKISGDGIKLNSPIFGCLLDHCDCSCIQSESKVQPVDVNKERIDTEFKQTMDEIFGLEPKIISSEQIAIKIKDN